MTLEELEKAVEQGTVDTVLLAITDMQGRLQGKRLTATHFLAEVVEHGAEGCNYLLAVDVDMATVEGYAMSSWERGYGDMMMVPDLDTLRPVPWQEGTVICLADVAWLDGSEVVASPRQILRRQLARLAERGWIANAGTELEFMVFLDTYEEAWHKSYRDLRPANLYNVDYSLLGTARVEPLIRRIRNSMAAAGMVVEDSKGECNFGQHEINFRYADALRTADEHAIFKNGAKEIAAEEGMAISFMAKYDEREGNSCHIHFSLADDERPAVRTRRERRLFDSFLAGQLACLREMTLLLAPNVNSYKRYAAASFAPTTVAWGQDNRTCSLRVVGHGPSKRFENRAGGADLNPYLALSAIIASGLHGVDAGLELEPALEGNAYADAERPRVPQTLRDARELFAAQRCRARGVRRGGRRPLPQRRRRRARGLPLRGHRLGALPRVRAAVSRVWKRWPVGRSARSRPPHRMRCSRPFARRRRSRRPSTGSAPRSSSACFAPGSQLPAERELCARLGIARSTLRQALTALTQSGHVFATRGRGGGTFVSDPQPPADPPSALMLSPVAGDLRPAPGRRAGRGGAGRRAGERRRAGRARRGRIDARGHARGLRRLPPGGHPAARRAGRGDGLDQAGPRDDRGAGRDDRPDRLHRPPSRGAGLLQRPAPAAARRRSRGRRDARRAGHDRAPAGHRARARGPAAERLTGPISGPSSPVGQVSAEGPEICASCT